MASVRGLAVDYQAGQRVQRHVHDVAQLVYARSGVLRTTTPDGVLVLPPQRALLVPAGVPHEHYAPVAAAMRTLYLSYSLLRSAGCQLLTVNGLARELIRTLATGRYDAKQADPYLAVLKDQLQGAPRLALVLPVSDEPVIAQITAGLLANPADPASPEEWGRRIGASGRTVARRFRACTGLTFDQWRRRARILRGMELRAQGVTLDACAHAAGYATASAFAHAFKAVTGLTSSASLNLPD